MKMLGISVSYLLKSMKRAVESGFEVSLESDETQRCFSMISLYYGDIF